MMTPRVEKAIKLLREAENELLLALDEAAGSTRRAPNPARPPDNPTKKSAGYDLYQDMITRADENAFLNDWERNFVDTLKARLAQYGENIKVSDKEEEILERCANKTEAKRGR